MKSEEWINGEIAHLSELLNDEDLSKESRNTLLARKAAFSEVLE